MPLEQPFRCQITKALTAGKPPGAERGAKVPSPVSAAPVGGGARASETPQAQLDNPGSTAAAPIPARPLSGPEAQPEHTQRQAPGNGRRSGRKRRPIKPRGTQNAVVGHFIAGAERKLALHVLVTALNDYVTYKSASGHLDEAAFYQARAWIMSDERDWPFSFANICDFLDLPPQKIRQALMARDDPLRLFEEDAG